MSGSISLFEDNEKQAERRIGRIPGRCNLSSRGKFYRIYTHYTLYRAHVHGSASVLLPVRDREKKIESGSLLSETGRELLECILVSPQAVIEFEIYDFNRD